MQEAVVDVGDGKVGGRGRELGRDSEKERERGRGSMQCLC